VGNVGKSMGFYETVFGLQQKFITDEKDYGELVTGSTTLSFASHILANSNLKDGFEPASNQQKPFGIELGMVVEDVPNTVEKAIQNGAKLLAPAVTKPWGQVVAYIQDLDGFLVEICTKISD